MQQERIMPLQQEYHSYLFFYEGNEIVNTNVTKDMLRKWKNEQSNCKKLIQRTSNFSITWYLEKEYLLEIKALSRMREAAIANEQAVDAKI
jgi:hypothetical protein